MLSTWPSATPSTAVMSTDRDSSLPPGEEKQGPSAVAAPSPRLLPPPHAAHSTNTAPRHVPALETPAQDQPGPATTFSSPAGRNSFAYDQGNKSNPEPSHSGYGYGHGYAKEQVERAPASSPSRTGQTSSFASFLPAGVRARLQLPTLLRQAPIEAQEDEDDNMGLTGEGRKTRRVLAEPLLDTTMSPPTQAASEGIPSPETTPKRIVRNSSRAVDNVPKSAGPATAPSKLSLLTMFSRNTPPSITPEMHDELLSMKVEEALFPRGTSDTFSPAAFKNLQTQAVGLLTKMQNAYRQKAEALSDTEKEREADCDELEEAETRSKHLKFQLEDMAHKVAEQEQQMKQLMEDLAIERRARAELERLNAYPKQRLSPGGLASEAGSTISEDLGVDEEEMQKRKWRKSNGTDTSFETDDDSISLEGESVFSRPRSPSVSTTITTRGVETGSVMDMPIPTPTSMRGPSAAPNKRTSVQSIQSNRPRSQMSTFQKLMKGISGEDGCRNCKGQDASVAWDTVSLLRDENKTLKQRVGELEDCVEVALDAVNGIGL